MALQGRHKSLCKSLKRSVAWLESLTPVRKVVLGFSECCRHKYAPGTIRFKMDVDGGFKANAYSGKGVTDIFVKVEPIEDREATKAALAERF